MTKKQHIVYCHSVTGCLGGGDGWKCETCVIWVRLEHPQTYRFVLFLRNFIGGFLRG